MPRSWPRTRPAWRIPPTRPSSVPPTALPKGWCACRSAWRTWMTCWPILVRHWTWCRRWISRPIPLRGRLRQRQRRLVTHLLECEPGADLLQPRTAGTLFKVGQHFLALPFQTDADDRVQSQPHCGGVGQRYITGDNALGLQCLHACQAGRRREMHTPGQLHVGERAIGLQFGQYAQIGGVELHMLQYWFLVEYCAAIDG